MHKKKLIFYQSIAEITEIIEILKQNAFGTFTIAVTGGEPLTKLIKKLKLNKKFGIKIYNFHALSLRNPINIIKMFLRYNYSSHSKQILSYSYSEVFFFSYGYDFVTPIFLSKVLAKKINFINFYKRKLTIGKPGIKDFIQILIVRLIFNRAEIKIVFDKHYRQIFYYPLKTRINKLSLLNKIPKPIFKLPISKNKKNKKIAIFFDAYEEVLIGSEFKKVLLDIFKLLERNGFIVIVKKHPVSDLSECVKNSKKLNYILDPYPVEFYKFDRVRVVFGLFSLSLTKITEKYPNVKVFSFLRIIKNANTPRYIKSYLNKMMKAGSICFPKNLSQLKEIINS